MAKDTHVPSAHVGVFVCSVCVCVCVVRVFAVTTMHRQTSQHTYVDGLAKQWAFPHGKAGGTRANRNSASPSGLELHRRRQNGTHSG